MPAKDYDWADEVGRERSVCQHCGVRIVLWLRYGWEWLHHDDPSTSWTTLPWKHCCLTVATPKED